MWRVPQVSLAYGAIFAFAGLLLAVGLTKLGLLSLIIVFAAGFILIGPMLAAGLYETSRRLETNEPVSLTSTLRAGFFRGSQLPYMGLFLTLIYLAWVEIALLLFMLFFGSQPMPPLEAFVPTLLLTSQGLGLLMVGTGDGSADEREGLPYESKVHGALGGVDCWRDVARLRDAFRGPRHNVPVDRSFDLACLP
jgi:uncharacterized membrane protein